MKYKRKHIIEYGLFRSVAGLVHILPLRAALSIAWLVAAFTHFIFKVHMKRTHARVREVFGDQKSDKEVRRIAWTAWRNLCFSAVEQMRFPTLTLDKIRKQPMASLEKDMTGLMEKNEAGFILVTPHYGNWELAAVAADLIGIPLCSIVRKQRNPLLNDYINKMRQSFSLELLFSDSSVWKGAADRIRSGKVLAIVPDIRAKKGITVDFLNNRSTVAPGAARFAQLTNAPIYPAFVRRIGWAKHDALLCDPIYSDPEADKEADQRRIMQEIMSVFSKEILGNPEQYFWFNGRWVLDPKEG